MAFSVQVAECVAAMRELPEASVDAIVTDCPYELGFMGQSWDASGVAFSVDTWRAALRVLKPGGHLLAFGGTRTYHRIACAIEDAGFEIRDSLHWIYGSGFPKSLDLGRAIDEHFCGALGRHYWSEAALPAGEKARPGDHVCARTELGQAHDGKGTGLKPAHEPIVLARKPLVGTVPETVLAHGTGGLNIEASRLQAADAPAGRLRHGGGAPSPQIQQLDPAKRNEMPAGRWPPNLLLTHSPGCTADACDESCPVAEMDQQSGEAGAAAPVRGTEPSSKTDGIFGKFAGRFEGSYFADRGGASRFFPAFRWDPDFDVPFLYVAKPSRAEKDAGLEDVAPTTSGEATEREDGAAGIRSPRAGAGRTGGARNFHPTVKPIALMEWLCRLVTPAGGLVLDPFTGSGTTGCAAVRQGFSFLGFEREAPYVEIALRRVELAAGVPRAKAIGELVRLKPAAVAPQMALFGRAG